MLIVRRSLGMVRVGVPPGLFLGLTSGRVPVPVIDTYFARQTSGGPLRDRTSAMGVQYVPERLRCPVQSVAVLVASSSMPSISSSSAEYGVAVHPANQSRPSLVLHHPAERGM